MRGDTLSQNRINLPRTAYPRGCSICSGGGMRNPRTEHPGGNDIRRMRNPITPDPSGCKNCRVIATQTTLSLYCESHSLCKDNIT